MATHPSHVDADDDVVLAHVLSRYPDVETAFFGGRPLRAFARLQMKLLTEWRGDARRDLMRVLTLRRRFGLRGGTPPPLGSMNGCGFRLYGTSQVPDGPDLGEPVRVGTAFVAVFFVPIWPVSQWVVSEGEDAGTGLFGNRTRYRFYGQIPLSLPMVVWRCVVAATVLAIVLRNA